MMETIFCPTDFSPAAGNALRYADQLAHWMQARLILFHNIAETALPAHQSLGGVLYEEPIRDPGYRQAQLARLEAWKDQLARPGGSQPIRYECQLRYGQTQDNIAAEAQNYQASLVVLGSKHREGLQQIIKGSVVGAVIRQSSCPVLLIPPDATFQPLSRIVFATSLLEEDAAGLTLMTQLAALFQAQILFLHIMPHYSAYERQEAETLYNRFRQKLPYSNTAFYIETHEDILPGINQFTRRHEANLLVIGYHPHSAWESFILGKHTQKMASHPTLPLLILPY